ncbi:hypothetical protein [Pontibacillus salipaludis]|uniref:Uncharacterized protein n=1 Tax=Pontibacillus salipaludis TaxID=1697394 RepID=A0ABQ1Q1Z6_9BACI|nr:hypothetical protein [Pontibacillus salipaludis]GGD10379.1 hypothetical protein GCM10011389_17430 [Pontibacillus salipaludis]
MSLKAKTLIISLLSFTLLCNIAFIYYVNKEKQAEDLFYKEENPSIKIFHITAFEAARILVQAMREGNEKVVHRISPDIEFTDEEKRAFTESVNSTFTHINESTVYFAGDRFSERYELIFVQTTTGYKLVNIINISKPWGEMD